MKAFSSSKGWWYAVAVGLILAGAFLFIGERASAHNYNPDIVWSSSITPRVTDLNTDYESEIQSARRDFNDNTDLAVYRCSWVCNGNLRHSQADYGDVGWAARTRRHGNPVTHAYVDWNGHYSQDSFTAHRLARHEMGHAFGLDHVPCGGGPNEPNIYSIMGCPESGVKVLHDHDIDDMNDKY